MNAKQESEKLMNSVQLVADTLLKELGGFHPFGGYMELDGGIVHVGLEDPGNEYPDSKESIDTLRILFQEHAQAKKCRAIAIVFDVALRSPGSDQKRDAVQVSIEHRDDYAVEVFFPYEIVSKEVIYGEIFAQIWALRCAARWPTA
jgi:hypothetical protein